jgi:hypothetical protein
MPDRLGRDVGAALLSNWSCQNKGKIRLARHPELDKLHARQLPGVNCGPAGIPIPME